MSGNIFATPVDTFGMTSGLYNAYAKGKKDADDLKTSQLNREALQQQMGINQQKFDWDKDDRQYQIDLAQKSQGYFPQHPQYPQYPHANGLAPTGSPQAAAGNPNAPNAPNGATDTASLIKGFEGYISTPKWDVNAHRAGYGSDTTTLADGTVKKIQPGMQVSREDAERDFQRRITTEFQPRAAQQSGQSWQSLPPAVQGALTSVAYNYGSLPGSVAKAAQTGDPNQIAAAVEGLAGHNNGINANRRMQEAAIIRTGAFQPNQPQSQPQQMAGGYDPRSDMPSPNAQEVQSQTQGFSIPGQAAPMAGQPQQAAPAAQPQPYVAPRPEVAQKVQQTATYWANVMMDPRANPAQRETAKYMYGLATSANQYEPLKNPKTGDIIGVWDKSVGRKLSLEEASARGITASADPQSGGLFDGTSVEGQALNLLVKAGRLTPEQAANIGAGKTITGPNGEIIFMTPEGVYSQPQQQQPSHQPPAPAGGRPQEAPASSGTAATPVPGIKLTEGKPLQMTEGQSNAALYSDRMEQAEQVITQPSIYESVMGGGGAKNNFLGKIPMIGNSLVTNEFQRYDQAKRNFINATLRRESGAVISPAEFENGETQYFPRFGDSEDTIKQKAENRRLAIDGIRRAAGPAYKPMQSSNQTQDQPAKLPSGVSDQQALSEARAAIAQGRDPALVRKRLESMGVKPDF